MEQGEGSGQPDEPVSSVAESPESAADTDETTVDGAADGGATADSGARAEAEVTPDADGEQVEEPGTTVPVDTGVEDSPVEAGWSGLELAVVALVAVIAAALGYVVARIRNRRAGPSQPTGPASQAPPPAAPPAPPSVVVVDEHRDSLVGALIDARDRVGESGVGDRIVGALHAAGVEVIDPTGDRFDPEQHVAAGQDRLTDDPSLDGRVADVVSYGYRDRGRVLRLPSVVVWRSPYVPEAVPSEVVR